MGEWLPQAPPVNIGPSSKVKLLTKGKEYRCVFSHSLILPFLNSPILPFLNSPILPFSFRAQPQVQPTVKRKGEHYAASTIGKPITIKTPAER